MSKMEEKLVKNQRIILGFDKNISQDALNNDLYLSANFYQLMYIA